MLSEYSSVSGQYKHPMRRFEANVIHFKTMSHFRLILNTGLALLFILNVASGDVRIVNNLGRPLYLRSVSNVAGPLQTLEANGGSYNEHWKTNPDGGGISVKMAIQPHMSDIIQFEYTVQDMIVYWDVSLINTKSHSPFLDEGFAVIPNRSDCIPAVCNPFDVNFLMYISTRTTTTQFVDAHGM